MAGRFADYVDAKVLLLNHISPAYSGDWNSMRMLVQEAEKAIQKSNTRVQASYDLLELLVPRDGFDFDNDTKKKAVAKTDSTINS
jgi:ribonuclease BN (tRNA processing enzyme)